MRLCGATDIGRVRKDNQDSYAFRRLDENTALLVVCDGMGGARAGSVASSIAVEVFVSGIEGACAGGVPREPADWQELLIQACGAANRQVYEKAESDWEYRGMGTTLVAALLLPGEAVVVNVGDSRCYQIGRQGIRQVTVDHSLVQLLVERGEIPPEEARTHPQKNLITRAVGVDREVACDVRRIELSPGDRLLLCSDGLSNVLTDSTIEQESGREADPDRFVKKLLELTLEQGAPDNVTVAVAQL